VIAARSCRHWALLALHVTLLLTGVVAFQVAAERTNRRVDLTRARSLSLSTVSERVLREIGAPVRVSVFHRRGTRAQYAPLLERMRAVSGHVEYQLFDLDRHPDRARALGVAQYGQAAVEYAGRRALVPALPEEQLVGGILEVLRGRVERVLFTTGHGERAPGGDAAGYGRFVSSLETENRRVETVALTAADVPGDAALVVVAGPRHDFLPAEIARLSAYLRRGGSILLLLEPGAVPNLAGLLSTLGIRVADDFIVDRERSVIGTDGLAAVVELFKRGNPISEPGGHVIGSGVVLPSARSVDVAADVPGVRAAAIARTAPTAWAMRGVDRARRGEAPSTAQADVPGGAVVMVMAEVGGADAAVAGRLVVVGDADFASDAYLDLLGNQDLALNAVAWLTAETAIAGERPRRQHEVLRPLSPLVLTEAQARRLLLGVGVVQPGLVLLAGALIVGARRRRG
jgi:ABC-type uncharacterized transport system involved in gliding motility auxiliary subunit